MLNNHLTFDQPITAFPEITAPWTEDNLNSINPISNQLFPSTQIRLNPALTSTNSAGCYIPYQAALNETSPILKESFEIIEPEEIHNIAKEILKNYEDVWEAYVKDDAKRLMELDDDL